LILGLQRARLNLEKYFSGTMQVEKHSNEANAKKMEEGQKWVFLATFINYAMAHWTRKSYTNVKVQLMLNGVSPLTLTAMDSGFMFTYAGGSFITGQLGDRFSPVGVVGGGLLGSTICLFLIAFGASTSIITNVALCGTWFLTCQLLHGAFQATGGPVSSCSYIICVVVQ
jgi:MFS transporter, OPA family, solute carrier family 37 (glycerol-3-phosphate transporter), member 1/2